jgi:plasmid maintenance system antidote protein VapI
VDANVHPSEIRFAKTLGAVCEALIERGVHPNKASVAKALGVDHPRLSKLLDGSVAVGAKTVAQLCSGLDRNAATDLLEAYLLDERDAVTRSARKKGRPIWGKDTLVKVERIAE